MSAFPRPGPRRVRIVVNSASGSGSAGAHERRIGALFEAAGASFEIALARSGAEFEAALEAAIAARPDVIVAAGGDGTVSSVGARLAGTSISLGVLPLGTLNHFAKDLGLPLELEEAVRTVVDGPCQQVDVGEVDGRVFVNNSSLGLYPDIVHERERQQRRLGRGKWSALLWATLATLRRYPFLHVRLTVDGNERRWKTPFVFVGNNEYRMEGFAIGERSTIDDGCLSLYVAQRPGRLRLLQLVLRALSGRLRQARDFEATRAAEIVVESSHRRLRVATDGEVTLMAPPLHYRIRPGCLTVVVPAPAGIS